jgi:hypothetical protein
MKALRLLFGHQSVGEDILRGLRELQARGERVPLVQEGRGPAATEEPQAVITHFRVGRNGDPEAKIRDFVSAVETGADGLDVALFKFCYVDIDSRERAEKLFSAYTDAMDLLQKNQPSVRVAHCTVPLRTLPDGIRWKLKALIGKRPPQLEHNRARELFNDKLRARYGSNAALFDLARLESGTGAAAPGAVPELLPSYSRDGGHLNENGRAVVASAFLKFTQALS